MIRTDFQHLLIREENGVLTITMNRPEVLNAFNETMIRELTAVLDEAVADEGVRCVVLTGAGRAFGSGQDLHAFDPPKLQEWLDGYHHVVETIRAMPKPVIAAVHGVTTGVSCNIALSCDLRIAADNLRFIEVFARIGVVPDGGGGYFLPRLVGMSKALELVMVSDEVTGAEAERIGLVNRCVPLSEFEATVKALAERLASGPTLAYSLIKQLMYPSFEIDLKTSLQLERNLQGIAVVSHDHHEGVIAFVQKRKAHYTGR